MAPEPSSQPASEFDFAGRYRERLMRAARPRRTVEHWDARAAAMNRNPFDSEYARAFVEHLDLRGCATLLDVGCGPGTIGLSVAAKLDHVYGLDYSPRMLEAFTRNAHARHLAARATPMLLGWDDDWAEVPVCDLVVASRSTAVADLEGALLKLDSKARVRVHVTYPADGRFVPGDVCRAIGRGDSELPDYLYLVGILHDLGLYPTIAYLPGENRLARCISFDEVHAKVGEFLGPLTADESGRLRRHYDAKAGRVGEEAARWVLASWEPRCPTGSRAASS
jgi:SAM-dependent methyltransferase